MENAVIHRIKEIIESKSLSPRSFAFKVGFNYSTLNNYLTGRRKSVDSKLLSLIASTYDDISPIWLLTGRGEMHLSGNLPFTDASPMTSTETSSPSHSSQLMLLQEELEKAKEAIYMLKGQNELLQNLVNRQYNTKKA